MLLLSSRTYYQESERVSCDGSRCRHEAALPVRDSYCHATTPERFRVAASRGRSASLSVVVCQFAVGHATRQSIVAFILPEQSRSLRRVPKHQNWRSQQCSPQTRASARLTSSRIGSSGASVVGTICSASSNIPLQQEPSQGPQEEKPSRRRSTRSRHLPRSKSPNEYDLSWYDMPRGRARGRGRGRRGRSCDGGKRGRQVTGKAWAGSAESLVPPDDPQLPVAAPLPSTAVARFLPDKPLVLRLPPSAEECSQDSKLLTASWSAVVECQLKADIRQLGNRPNCAADSEGAKLHFSLDTQVLAKNVRRSPTSGEPSAYRSARLKRESLSNRDANVRRQRVSRRRSLSAGPRSRVTDPQIFETSFVGRSKCIRSEKQYNPFFTDHNHNFLSSTSGSPLEVLQSDDENSVGSSTPSTKHQCFCSAVPATLDDDTVVSGKFTSTSVYCSKEADITANETSLVSRRISEPSSTVWDFAPPLEVPQIWPVSFDRPTKQNLEFITSVGPDSASLDTKISRQPEVTLPSRNTSTLFSHYSLSKWRFKPPTKLRHVKSVNAALKRIQKEEGSNVFIALDQGLLFFCSRCCRPGRVHPKNQNKIIKKRFHRKKLNNLHIFKNQKLSKISDKNGEIKCCSCHRPLWKCHKNNNMFKTIETTPKSHPVLGVMNETEEITRIQESEGTKDAILKSTNKLQNNLSHSSDGELSHISNTAAEDNGSKVFTNFEYLNQNSDPTSNFKFQNVTLVVCMPSKRDSETIVEAQRVLVPCQTGREFMEMSNKSNPYPYKISGIFGSENGISACLEDRGDLSDEFDFDINNSGELTLPCYEPQLVVSKDKAETWNVGENNVFLTVLCKHSSFAEGISQTVETAEKTSGDSETDTPVDNSQPPLDVREQFNSIEDTHQVSNEASEDAPPLSEVISSDINKTVFHEKNHILNVGITAHNHKIDSSVIMPQTVDNMREQLTPTENTQREDTDSQIGGISPIMIKMLGHNEGSARSNSCNGEKAGQNSTMNVCEATDCFVCIKQESEVLQVGEYSKKTLKLVNANLLQNTDLCSNHSTCRKKINTCENSPVYFSESITVKEEKVKVEVEDIGPDGTCYSVHCHMCDEEKKRMHRMVARSSSNLGTKDILLAQIWQNDGCSSDTNSSINNSSGEVGSLLVQSSDSNANRIDLTVSDKEELYQQQNSSRSSEKTAGEVSEREEVSSLCIAEPITGQDMVSMMMELQDPVSSGAFVCGDDNNCIEEQVAERPNSLSSNSTEAFDYVDSDHEKYEVENRLRNFFSENSEDSSVSEMQLNDTLCMERGTEYRLCNIQEQQNVPHESDKQFGIAHKNGFKLTCDSSSTIESQNCVIKVAERKLTTESTEDSHNAENEINYNISSTECHSLIMKCESPSDQEHGSCISDSETNSDINESVITEIRPSESTSNNQHDGEDMSLIIGSGCSPVSSMTDMKYSDNFMSNHADDKSVPKCSVSSFNTEEACKSVDSDCTSTLDMVTINHSEPVDSFYSQETRDCSDFNFTSTIAATLDSSVDHDITSTAETMHDLKTVTDSSKMEQKYVPSIRVSIPLSSITDRGLLESLVSERKRRKAGHTGPPRTQTSEGRNLEKSSDVQYSPTSNSKRKALNRYEIKRMNGRGKRTLEKVSQVNEAGDQSAILDVHSHKGSEKIRENDDGRARDVIELSNSATTKYRAAIEDNEKHNAKEICKDKNAHPSVVVTQYEEGSDEEGELQICEEPLEGDQEGGAQDVNSEENIAVLSHENIVEEKQWTSEHLYESDKLIKAQNIEGSNVTPHHKDDDHESSQYSCENPTAQIECQSSVSVECEALCKRKLFTDDRDESQMIKLSNVVQKDSLSQQQKFPEINQPCGPLQKVEQLSTETSGPIVSGDGNLSDMKAREAMEVKVCDSSDMLVSFQSEKGTLNFDEGSNRFPSKHRIGAEDTITPFRKVSRKTINEKDVHGKNSEEQEIRNSHSSVCMNDVFMYSSSKSSTRRISSKGRTKHDDLDSLPPSYQILRRDLNELLEQENLCQASYSSPRKVAKKVGGYRRPRCRQKMKTINDTDESTRKKIKREESDCANLEVKAEDQDKSFVQKETEHTADQNTHTTKLTCQQDTNMTVLGNPDVHQHHQKEKKPEEMKVHHDKPTLPEKDSAMFTLDQCNTLTNKRRKCTVRLKRCDRFWIQCANESESTVVESGDIGTEKTPVPDECGEIGTVPEKNSAAEHTPQELFDHGDKSSVLSKCSETEMKNRTSVAKEQLGGHPKQLLTERKASQNIEEYDHKSLVCTGRKDDVSRLSVEETVHHSPSSENEDEAVCFHGHKLAVEASHSQHKKLPSLVENKERNICTVGEQSQQSSPEEFTAPDNNVKNPNQATTHSSPVHQSRRDDFAKKGRGNLQQDHSVKCCIDDDGDETNRSSYRVAASHSEVQVPQNFVERRSESPHFENIDSQLQETAVDSWQQELQKRMADLLSTVKKGEHIKNVDAEKRCCETVAKMMTQVLEQMKESQKNTQLSLQDGIQTEQHVSASDAPCDSITEQSVPTQLSQEPKVEFQEHRQLPQPVSECEENNEQHSIQKPLQKSATDFQDAVEEQSLTQPVSECEETNEEDITEKPLQKSATDFQDTVEKQPLTQPVSECEETNEEDITQKPLQKSATASQDTVEEQPLSQPVSECEETNEEGIIQKPLQKSATDFQDPVEKLSKSNICEVDSKDVALTEREPPTHKVEGSQTKNDTVPPAQHTGHESQIHDIGPQLHTSQPQQTVTNNQFLPQESLLCSERQKRYSKWTPADQEETIGHQKVDQQYAIQNSLKERQQLQKKDVETRNSQAQILTQQQVQDQHRVMLNTIKQQKQQISNVQQIPQEKEPKCHKELQQSSLQQSVIQTRAAVQQWHHTQQRTAQHHQTQCMDVDKAVPQQQNVYCGPTLAEKAAGIVQNPMGCHQALLRQQQQQQQQLQHLASLEQQPLRQLAAMPNPMEQPQQSMQQQMEWQQQRATHHISKQYSTVEHQAVSQNQQQPHPYHRFYYPQVQQHYQLPHNTEAQLRPNYPQQYHSRFSSPPTWNSNSHLLRQMPSGPLDGQQLQQQQQQYPHFHYQQQLEKWHSSRRPGTDEAATVPAVLASPSMSGGTVVEPEHDRRRVLSREAINSFDTGHRIGAVPSSSCPVTPTENIHTAQVHPSQAYMRAGPHPQPNSSTAPMQAPLNTGPIHQRSTKVAPPPTVDQDQQPPGEGKRFRIPTPPHVSEFVERVMKHYQPEIVSTEDTYRHQYKLPERELAARFAFPQDSVYTRHGTTSIQLPYSQPVMMFPEHTRIPASPTQLPLNKTIHSAGQFPHRVFVPQPASSFESVTNLPVNIPVNFVQPAPVSTNVNVHRLLTELAASSASRISLEPSLPSVRDSENVNCDCNVIDLSQDKNSPEDNGRCHIVKCSERTPRGTELHHPILEKTNSTSSSKAADEVPQPSDCIQDNVLDNLQLNSPTTKTGHHSVSLGEKRKSETLCGTSEKRLCQDSDNEACALPFTGTHQVTAVDLSPSTVVDCTAKSTPSQSSPHVLGASYPQLCATIRPVLDSKQHVLNGKGASYINCNQKNQELCTVSCCEQSKCATHSTRLAAAGSTCCGTTQQSHHTPNDER